VFERGIEKRLAEWAAQGNRKPLLLRGARQVGKTFAVRRFAARFDCFIELNLEHGGDRAPFGRGLEVEEVFQAIVLRKHARPVEGRTLLFLDEIQECPEAVHLLRYFHEKLPHLHVIGAGSLLEIALAKAEIEFPVGRVQHLVMYPLSFAEYLNALGEAEAVSALNEVPLPPRAEGRLLELFHRYALVGGMPEVVARYAEKRDAPALRDLYESLLQSYLDDVPKYARNDTMARVLDHCIRTAPGEAGNRIAFAGFGQSNYRSREVGEALRTLENALLLHLLYPTTATQIPIRPDLRKAPRLQFLDTGLLNYCAGLQEQYFLHADLHSFYRGLMAEHIVAQELLCHRASLLHKPCFWVREKSQSSAEVDFVVEYRGRVIPVEVKAGKTGRLRSLHQFVDAANPGGAVRLYAGALNTSDVRTPAGTPYRLLSLPYYLAPKIADYLRIFGVSP
jgi:predicted AAA+ superfamily ATPase